MLASARFHPPAPASETAALDLSEALIGRGVPFRSAHEAVGRLVTALESEGRPLAEATVADLEAAHPLLTPEDLALLDPIASARRRASPGGGSPASVLSQAKALRELLTHPGLGA
jgi:argininosuccinate lyase